MNTLRARHQAKSYTCWITRRGCTLAWTQTQARRLAPAARGGIPVETRIPASERTSQKLSGLLTQGVAEGDARSELIKLAVRKIVEEALEAEVAEAVGRGYYESGAGAGGCARRRAPSTTACRRWPIGPSRSS